MKKDVPKKVEAPKSVSAPKKVIKSTGIKKKITKSSNTLVFTGHYITHFEEIGWISPTGESEESHNIIHAKFSGFIYDVSKYIKEFPPLMVYWPN